MLGGGVRLAAIPAQAPLAHLQRREVLYHAHRDPESFR